MSILQDLRSACDMTFDAAVDVPDAIFNVADPGVLLVVSSACSVHALTEDRAPVGHMSWWLKVTPFPTVSAGLAVLVVFILLAILVILTVVAIMLIVVVVSILIVAFEGVLSVVSVLCFQVVMAVRAALGVLNVFFIGFIIWVSYHDLEDFPQDGRC